MGLDRLPNGVRLAFYGCAVSGLLYLCLAPARELPQVNIWDKAEHAAAWLALTALGLSFWPRRWAQVAMFTLAFGGFVEVLQQVLPFGRAADWRDFLADALAVLAALLMFASWRRARA